MTLSAKVTGGGGSAGCSGSSEKGHLARARGGHFVIQQTLTESLLCANLPGEEVALDKDPGLPELASQWAGGRSTQMNE